MRLFVLLLALTAVTACGLTGDLYLPEPKQKPAPAAVEPVPPAESTQVPVEEKDKDDENPSAPRTQ
jgi:predicted small lipoprotein YifL